ncbi:AAA family ATPase [Bradyrhizobium sp. LeoA1S1]
MDDKTLVVVDEASMTDVPTVHAIAKRPVAGSRLLFVGDEAQLPRSDSGSSSTSWCRIPRSRCG